MTPPPTVAAVVFDCDGVLADTDDAWADVERLVCQRHGGRFSDALRLDTRFVDVGDRASFGRAYG